MENQKKSGNKDFTIDLTSKKAITASLFPHWNLNGFFLILDFMIHLLNSLAALVGDYSIH